MSDQSFEPDGGPQFEELRRELVLLRNAGRLHVGLCRLIDALAPASTTAAFFVESRGLRAPRTWTEVDRTTALQIATNVLLRDLAYEVPVMPLATAADLAKRFLAYFDESGASYLTNGTRGERRGGSWEPLTDATFDTGLVCVTGRRVGLLWVEDED